MKKIALITLMAGALTIGGCSTMTLPAATPEYEELGNSTYTVNAQDSMAGEEYTESTVTVEATHTEDNEELQAITRAVASDYPDSDTITVSFVKTDANSGASPFAMVYYGTNEVGIEELSELMGDLNDSDMYIEDESAMYEGGAASTESYSEPMVYGDDPYLDGLYDDCESGDSAACDDLYIESPYGSEYESFAQEQEPMSYGDDEHLDGLYDECESGDQSACDDLYYDSPIGSDYESFADEQMEF